jgi:hypothetical protein
LLASSFPADLSQALIFQQVPAKSHVIPAVPGYSGTQCQTTARLLRDRYPHILENEAVEIGDVRFVGATLWTDFRLNGCDPELAMSAAQSGMNDYRKIKFPNFPTRRSSRSTPIENITSPVRFSNPHWTTHRRGRRWS